MDTRAPVAVEDMITEERFPAEWIIRHNTATKMILAAAYTASDLWIPVTSFLGTIVEAVWKNDRPAAQLFREHGYPVRIVTMVEGIEETWFCVLRRSVNYSTDGTIMKCNIECDEPDLITFSHILELWREFYEKEKASNKETKSS